MIHEIGKYQDFKRQNVGLPFIAPIRITIHQRHANHYNATQFKSKKFGKHDIDINIGMCWRGRSGLVLHEVSSVPEQQ